MKITLYRSDVEEALKLYLADKYGVKLDRFNVRFIEYQFGDDCPVQVDEIHLYPIETNDSK